MAMARKVIRWIYLKLESREECSCDLTPKAPQKCIDQINEASVLGNTSYIPHWETPWMRLILLHFPLALDVEIVNTSGHPPFYQLYGLFCFVTSISY